MRITELSVKKPVAVIALMLLVVVFGILSVANLPVDLLPDIKYPMIKIHVFWPGATPEEIEDEIAEPVESVVSTIEDLDYIQSVSKEGMYRIFINFIYGTDQDIAFQDVLAKLAVVQKDLPSDIDPPVVLKSDPSQLPIMKIGISSQKRDLVRLRMWVENFLQDRMQLVRGVASTEVIGGLEREIRVLVDAERLHGYGLSFNDLTKAIKEENIEMLGGRITGEKREFVARTMGEFKTLQDLKDVIIGSYDNAPVYVSDVAEVVDSHEEQRIYTRQNGKPCVQLSVSKQSEANTIEVAKAVEKKLTELKSSIPEDISLSVIYSQADYIEAAMKNVRSGALLGAFLVILIVYLFLTGIRRILIMGITFPVAIAGTFIIMNIAGFNINLFSIGGLAIALGVLLDNCVVVLENITRYHTLHPPDRKDVTLEATGEVFAPLTAGTITFILLFIPFLFASGTAVVFFRELVMTIAFAVVISLVCALTVVPTLAELFFPSGRRKVKKNLNFADKLSEKVLQALKRPYSFLLQRVIRKPYFTALIAVGFLLISVFIILPRTGSEFLPRLDDGQIWVKVKMPTGTGVKQTDKVLKSIENVVTEIPDITTYFTLSGGQEYSLLTYEIPNEGQVNPQLVPKGNRSHSRGYYISNLQKSANKLNIPEAKIKVRPAPIKGVKGAASSDIEIKVRGPDIFMIDKLCRQIIGEIKGIEGISNIDLSLDLTRPEYQIIIDRYRAKNLGLSVKAIASTVKDYIYGAIPTQFTEEGEEYDIRVSLADKQRTTIEDVENIFIDLANGKFTYLKDVAEVKEAFGPLQIDREDQVRQIIVEADALGRSPGAVTADIKEMLADFSLPEGYEIDYGGQEQLMRESTGSLGIVMILAIFLAYIALTIQFDSFVQPVIIIISFFTAISGSIVALFISRIALSTPVAVALLYVAGTTVSNGVIMLTYIRFLRKQGLEPVKAVMEAGPLRLRPVVMTIATSIMALLPLAVLNMEGMEVLKPLAVAAIGGLVVSPVMTLLIIPCFYLIFEAWKKDRVTAS